MRFKNQKGNNRFLKHYGMPRRSGRYPWGSGKKPQRNKNIYNVYLQLHQEGFTDKEISEEWGISQNRLKAIRQIGRAEQRSKDVARAEALLEKGYSKVEIGRRMGINESSVRSLLDEGRKVRMTAAMDSAETIREFIDKHKYVDVGKGTEVALGIKSSKMDAALELLRVQGYQDANIFVDQMGTNYQTKIKCLMPPGMEYKELYEHRFDILPVSDTVIDSKTGIKLAKSLPVNNIDISRVAVKYKEEGGVDKDGVIEIRPGCEDLNLGKARYAQVRIGVNGTHYAKGMCVYGDPKDFPPGCDILVNSNKAKGTPILGKGDESVLKEQKSDPKNPFGASIKDAADLKMVQATYTDKDGKEHASALNIVNEEGNWATWTKSLSSQFLSKQRPELAKQQLDQKYTDKAAEFETIMSLNNPTIKRVLLEKFADGCDGAAQDLKAAPLPRQAAKVILPAPSLKDGEIYAPHLDNGTRVVLIRHPHASITEIPQLVVNNNNKEARAMIGNHPTDAVCINPKAAQQLSGADFDGDSVLVIPANNPGGKVRIKTEKQYKALEGFDTGTYKLPKDWKNPETGEMQVDPSKVMNDRTKGKQMGVVSNLITDMTLQNAPEEHMIRAIKHSMVVIDAKKHELDWKRSEQECGIEELKHIYQKSVNPETGEVHYGGASTIVSRAKSKKEVEERKAITGISEYHWDEKKKKFVGNTDPNTGEVIRTPTGSSYTTLSVKLSNGKKKAMTIYKDKETGRPYHVDPFTKEKHFHTEDEMDNAKIHGRKQWSTKMAEAKDAFTLTSGGSREDPGHPMEGVYANYANQMKDLANRARKEYLNTPRLKQDKEARKEYQKEYDELAYLVLKAKSNAPLERKAQLLANKEITLLKEKEPDIDFEHLSKAKGKAITSARQTVGAKKEKIEDFTDRQWEAIQKGAISDSMLLDILNNCNLDKVKERAMPRQQKYSMTPAKEAVIKAMSTSYTQAEIAARLGISSSMVSKVINS